MVMGGGGLATALPAQNTYSDPRQAGARSAWSIQVWGRRDRLRGGGGGGRGGSDTNPTLNKAASNF
jgi:hypothetical protein